MPSPNAPYLAGFEAGISFNGTPIAVSGWNYNDETELVGVDDTSNPGVQMLISGIKRDSASMTMWFRLSATPLALGLSSGMKGTLTTATGYGMPCRIARVGNTMVVNGAVGVQVELRYSAI